MHITDEYKKFPAAYVVQNAAVGRRASKITVFQCEKKKEVKCWVLVAVELPLDSHDGQIWFPVSGAQQAQADIPVRVYVLRDAAERG